MSNLFSALKTTFSAFNTINSAIQVAGDNIANANNEDYNRQIEVYEDLRYGGVKLTDITRLVDEGLRRDYLMTTTDSAEDEVLRTLYEQLEELTGGGLGYTYLSDTIQEFGDAWKAFEAAPENYAAEREVVRIGYEIEQEFERLSAGVDQLEFQINQDIEDLVDSANELMDQIDRLNEYIIRDQSKNISTASYENNRDAALTDLAKIIDIRLFSHDNGALTVYSAEGLSLVSLDNAEFAWDLNTMSLSLTGNSGNLVGTSNMPGGELGAKINMMRTDVEATDDADYKMAPLQKFRNQLDELAFHFVDDSTALSQGNLPFNTNDIITEQTGITDGDSFTLQTATFDSAGVETLQAVYTINITNTMTLEDVVAEINALTIPTGEPELRARVTGHGSLEISTNAGDLILEDTNGTTLTTLGLITATPQRFEERDPPTFAKAYNDITAETGQSEIFFETRDGDTPMGGSRMNFRINRDLFNGETTLKDLSGNAVMEALYANNRTIKGSSVNFDDMTYLGLGSSILTDMSARASHATSRADTTTALRDGLESTLRNKVGVDIDEEMMKLTVLENSYSAAAKALDTIQKMFEALEGAV